MKNITTCLLLMKSTLKKAFPDPDIFNNKIINFHFIGKLNVCILKIRVCTNFFP